LQKKVNNSLPVSDQTAREKRLGEGPSRVLFDVKAKRRSAWALWMPRVIKRISRCKKGRKKVWWRGKGKLNGTEARQTPVSEGGERIVQNKTWNGITSEQREWGLKNPGQAVLFEVTSKKSVFQGHGHASVPGFLGGEDNFTLTSRHHGKGCGLILSAHRPALDQRRLLDIPRSI